MTFQILTILPPKNPSWISLLRFRKLDKKSNKLKKNKFIIEESVILLSKYKEFNIRRKNENG